MWLVKVHDIAVSSLCEADRMVMEVPEYCFRALCSAFFLACGLKLQNVGETAKSGMISLVSSIYAIQICTYNVEQAEHLAWTATLIHVARKAFAQTDISTGDVSFDMDPAPDVKRFFVDPRAPSPVQNKLDQWSADFERKTVERMAIGVELLGRVLENCGETLLRHLSAFIILQIGEQTSILHWDPYVTQVISWREPMLA